MVWWPKHRAPRVAVIIVLTMAAVILATWLALSTTVVRIALAEKALGSLLPPGQVTVVGDASGAWPSEIVLRDILIRDTTGPWMSIGQIDLRWSPRRLLSGRFDADLLAVTRAHITRLPATQPAPPSRPVSLAEILEQLGAITVRRLTLDNVTVDAPVMGTAFTANAAGVIDGPRQTLALDVTRTDRPGRITASVGRDGADVRADISTDMAGWTIVLKTRLTGRDNSLSGQFTATCGAQVSCMTWTDAGIGTLNASGTIGGTLAAPRATIEARAADIHADGRRLPLVDARGDATLDSAGALSLALTGNAGDLRPFVPEAAILLDTTSTWSAVVRRGAEGLVIDQLEVKSGTTTISGQARWATTGAVSARAEIAAVGAGRLAGLDDPSSQARLTVDFDSARPNAGGFQLEASAIPSTGIGGPLRAQGAFTLDAATFSVRDVTASWGAIAAGGNSTWTRTPTFDHAQSRLSITAPEQITAIVTFEGPLATLAADVGVKAVKLTQVPLTDIDGKMQVQRDGRAWRGTLGLSARHGDQSVNASSIVRLEGNTLTLSDTNATGLSATLTGDVTANLGTMRFTGALTGKVADLAPLGALAGVAASGSAEIKLNVTADDGIQRAALHVDGRDVATAALEAERLVADASIADIGGANRISVSITAPSARALGRPLAGFALTAQGPASALEITAEAKGLPEMPFSFVTTATVNIAEETVIALKRFVLQDGAFNARLRAPTTARISPALAVLEPAVIDVEDGPIEAAVRVDRAANSVDGRLTARRIVPAPSTAAPSSIDADVRITGAASNADLDASFAATYNADRTGLADNVTFRGTIDMGGGWAVINATAQGFAGDAPSLTARIAATLDLAAARLAMNATAPLTAKAHWNGDIAPLWQLLALDQHALRGQSEMNLDVAGTLERPDINGRIDLAAGVYENFVSGTALRDVNIALAASGNGPITVVLSAQDADGGQLSIDGQITRGGAIGAWDTALSATLDRLHVLRRDDVIAAASGKLAYAGGLFSGKLSGALEVVRSTVRLGGTYMPEVPLLRSRDAAVAAVRAEADAGFSSVSLDVSMGVADILRIEGNGLESFWRGNLRARGNLAKPDLVGELTLARGTFSFLGQTFQLDSGTVTFTGGGKIEPDVLVVASRQVEDVTATVTIRGSARAPTFTLGSQPPLPRDEILARILFRKDVGALGPIESLQLASAAASLTGLSRGGITGFLRRTLGVDTLSLGGSSGNALAIGRQISGSLYVGLEQDLTDSARKIVVEWRLTPSLSLRSATDGQAGADLGVIWRKNY